MSLKEPLIVHHEREIPQEVMWHLQDGKEHRDTNTNHPNRYWFRFPEQWYNQYGKDPILGIRAIYVAKTIRCVSFKATVTYWNTTDDTALLYTDPTTGSTTPLEFTFTMRAYLDTSDTIHKACTYWYNRCTLAFTTAASTFSGCNLLTTNYDRPTMLYSIQDTPYNMIVFNTPANDESMTYEQESGTVNVQQRITIESLSDDNEMLFDLDNGTVTSTKVSYPIMWDRYQCFVKSSISALTTDQYLGHTRNDHYNPIKYFRINTREQSFYVDLYSTRNHGAYVILPDDDLDDLIIEGIVCFDSSAII